MLFYLRQQPADLVRILLKNRKMIDIRLWDAMEDHSRKSFKKKNLDHVEQDDYEKGNLGSTSWKSAIAPRAKTRSRK